MFFKDFGLRKQAKTKVENHSVLLDRSTYSEHRKVLTLGAHMVLGLVTDFPEVENSFAY
jgi:hypothetical protein